MLRWPEAIAKPSEKTLREFGFAATIIAGAWFFWLTRQARYLPALLLGVAAIVILIFSLAAPRFLRPLQAALVAITFPIGWFLSWLALAILFYGVFTPFAVVFRLVGRDALRLRFESDRDSYWIAKEHDRDLARYFRQF